MNKILISLLLLGISRMPIASDFLRTPAPSPDSTKIAFSARGNLWVVDAKGGEAQALTTHPAYEGMPVWSPDGKRIAFSSDRNGNDDLFVMNADGTDLRQLTYMSVSETACDFSPDGSRVLFASLRDFSWMRHPSLWEIPVEGGEPKQLFKDFGTFGAYSPDGVLVAYTPRVTYYYTKNYDGTGNMRINLYDRKAGTHKEVVGGRRDSAHAMWAPDGRGFYFITDRDRVSNIWYLDLASNKAVQKTFLKDGDITYPRISRSGAIIAFEYKGGITLYETATGALRPLQVRLPQDRPSNAVQFKTFTSNAGEFAVSDEEKQIAFTVVGEIFIQRLMDEATPRQLTKTAVLQEDLALTKDEKTLYFTSNRNGNREIFKMESDDPAEARLAYALRTKTTPVVEGPEEARKPILSPDGKFMLFIQGNGNLMWLNLEKGTSAPLAQGWNVKTIALSPDGAWAAFSREDNDFNEDIFIVSTKGGEPANVTRHPAYDSMPVFSPDGKYLAFLSNRDNYKFGVWVVWLTKAEEAKTEEQRKDEEDQKKKKPDASDTSDKPDKKEKSDRSDKSDKSDKKEAKIEVKIDFDRIWYRVHKLTELPGDESRLAVSHDSKKIAFVSAHEGKKDLYVIDRTGENLKRLTSGGQDPSQFRFSKDDANVFLLNKDGGIQKAKSDGSKSEPVKFSVQLALDEPGIREEVFREGWAVLKHNFYDPKFHGVDWDAMLAEYLPMAKATVTRRDFDTVMNMMEGELNASHLGIYPPKEGSFPTTGFLGVRLDEAYTGVGVKVASVVPKSPADNPLQPLAAGDILTAIDGVIITGEKPLDSLLAGASGKWVVVAFKRMGKDMFTRIRCESLKDLRDQIYDDDVVNMRHYVDRISGGRVAYAHIRVMDEGSYDRFQMELFSESYGKDALIIDVRSNGGGWTTDMLLQLLSQKPHAVTVPRDGGQGYPDFERKHVYTWKKPFVVLCNQDSFSNAEIFAHAIKTLGLAKIVGVETNGSVISTDEVKLLDGSDFRMPTRGWYIYGTGENMEMRGAVPDFTVENPPEIWGRDGKDLQVEKAVQVVMKQIGK